VNAYQFSEEIKKEIGKMVLPFTFIVAYEHIICFSPIELYEFASN